MLFKLAFSVLTARLYKPSSRTPTISRQRPSSVSAVYSHPTWSGEPKTVFPTNLLRLLVEGLSKLDLRISCCSLIIIMALYCVLCSHLCLTLSAGDLSGWKVPAELCVWGGKREVSNVEFSFCQSMKLRTQKALWSFHREITSLHDWDACCHKQGFLSSSVPIGTVETIWLYV